MLNVEKALELDRLKAKVSNMKTEYAINEENTTAQIKRMTSGLEFSKEANINLKADYDLFQEKFDKHAKASNNLN